MIIAKKMPKNKNSSANSSANNSSSFGSPNPSPFENDALGFVYKNLINRDPTKRKIKPVESILSMEADFDDSESDDSDYKPNNLEPDDVEIESDTEDINVVTKKSGNNLSNNVGAKKRKGKTKDQGNNIETVDVDDSDDDDDEESSSSESDSDDSDEESESESDNDKKKPRQKSNEKLLKTDPSVNISSSSSAKNSLTQEELASSYKKILICAVCLGDVSHYEDEIVECDACGISVHELCYGINADDTESIHSNASSASTEPWFCDPCKAGVRDPLCQLCPTLGGIFKIADNGRWVHMVCALYTPNVTFVDPEKLRGPILTEINYGRWGSKICMLCEDDRFSQTGVCICCDAGMCKTYFHVTCAQREGLLTELRHSEEVDPFIAYCRLHSDRAAAKKKRRNYHALVARYRFLMKNQKKDLKFEDSITNQRTLNKLNIQREKFAKNIRSFGNASGYPKPTPRFLDASPSAVRRLINRNELAGFPYSRVQMLQDELTDIRKKWYIPPAFSVEFVSYYIDRNDRINQMRTQSKELMKQNENLKERESEIFAKFNQLLKEKEQKNNENDEIRSKIRRYFTILSAFMEPTPSTSSGHDNKDNDNEETNRMKLLKLGQQVMNLPEMKSLSDQEQELSNGGGSIKLTKNEFQLKECATCNETKEQHMMALCDSCHLYYHLQCLDPPLRRMPKKTRFGGWQCSNCTENEEQNEMDNDESMNHNRSESQNGTISSNNEDSVTNSDIVQTTSTKRKLRENPKTVSKYTDYDDGSNLPGTSSNNSAGKKKDKTAINSNSNKRIKNRSNTSFSNALQKTPNDLVSTNSNNSAAVTDNPNVNNSKSNNRRASRKKKTPSPSRQPKTSVSPASSVSNEKTETVIKTSSTATNQSRKRKLTNSPEISLIEACEPKLENDDSNSNVKAKFNKASSKSNATVNAPIKRSGQNVQAECFVCQAKLQSNKQSVRCDNCGNDYHFGCLKPPMTKSPKRRGYTWCCFVCEKKDQKRSESASTSILATSLDSEIETKPEQDKSHQSNKVIKKRNEKAESTTITVSSKKLVKKEDGKMSESIVISPQSMKKVAKTKQDKIVEISLLQKTNIKPEKEIIIIDEDEEKEKEENGETNPVATILNADPKLNDQEIKKSCPEQLLSTSTTVNDNVNSGIVTNELKPPPPLLANHNDHHDKDIIETNETNQPATSNNNVNNIDDINTVLNDIIMLEEEAQNTKKQQQQGPTIQDTAVCEIINQYNDNEKSGTDKLVKEIGMIPAQQQQQPNQPEVITTTNGGDSMLNNDNDTKVVVGGDSRSPNAFGGTKL